MENLSFIRSETHYSCEWGKYVFIELQNIE